MQIQNDLPVALVVEDILTDYKILSSLFVSWIFLSYYKSSCEKKKKLDFHPHVSFCQVHWNVFLYSWGLIVLLGNVSGWLFGLNIIWDLVYFLNTDLSCLLTQWKFLMYYIFKSIYQDCYFGFLLSSSQVRSLLLSIFIFLFLIFFFYFNKISSIVATIVENTLLFPLTRYINCLYFAPFALWYEHAFSLYISISMHTHTLIHTYI